MNSDVEPCGISLELEMPGYIKHRKMVQQLEKAQSILSDIYHFACDEGYSNLESIMSVADGCIIDAVDILKKDE